MRSLVIEIIFTRWSRIVGDLDLSRVGSLEIGAMSTWDEDSFRGDVGDAMLGAIVVMGGGSAPVVPHHAHHNNARRSSTSTVPTYDRQET